MSSHVASHQSPWRKGCYSIISLSFVAHTQLSLSSPLASALLTAAVVVVLLATLVVVVVAPSGGTTTVEAAARLAIDIANGGTGADGAILETGAAARGAVGVGGAATGDELLALLVADVGGASGVTDGEDGDGDYLMS